MLFSSDSFPFLYIQRSLTLLKVQGPKLSLSMNIGMGKRGAKLFCTGKEQQKNFRNNLLLSLFCVV